jgi:hypothetical protein
MAIAGVSATLRSLLRDRMDDPVDVTIAPPDVSIDGMTGRRANLYLFDVTENAFLKNQQIPGQGHPSDYGLPPLALQLRYLLTAHGATPDGADADLQAQRILGDAMRVFHEYPIITDGLHEDDNPGSPLILDPSLVGEFERVKVTLAPHPLEEVSKIWMAQPENSAFRRSVIYDVSVVEIESRRPRRSPLPVRRRAVYAFPFSSPFIEELFREPPFETQRSAIVEVGDTLVITGRNLAGLSTRVRLDNAAIVVPSAQSRRISVVVPATIRAGARTVQVLQDLPFEAESGQPPVLHRGFESNTVPLLVLPRFQSIAPPAARAGDLVTVTVAPAVAAEQARSLLLGDREIVAEAVPAGSPPSTSVTFHLPNLAAALAAGTYLARVRIDGAESRLTLNAAGTYDGPTFTVTP